jgi:predicted nucleotidyltransferase
MTFILNKETEEQINQCLSLLKDNLKQHLLGVYLYGSSILGGLQKYSDIDLFVVTDQSTTREEKARLAVGLLQISGIYMKSSKLPIEMTIVEKSEINPWHYPPHFDFQYGDWLRKEFESGIVEPWPTKEMPDLALLITQVLLASKILLGPNPDQLLCRVPYHDIIFATAHSLKNLMLDLDSDTRNVLLTYARIWSMLETDAIRTKTAAADWAIDNLPAQYRPAIKRARAISTGEVNEYWDDIQPLIKPCVDFMVRKIELQISVFELADNTNKLIKIAE